MRAIGLVAIILLLVFILPVYADDAGTGNLIITFTTSEEWLVANGADSCQATVQVNNGMGAVPGLEVELSVPDTDYGFFDQPIVFTDPEGKAVSTFKVNHKSGTATLKATITDPSGIFPVIDPKECTQKIDHDTPWMLSSYEVISETTVGTIVPITMKYQDRWGNPVDNKRIAETITFMVSAPARDALFQGSNDIVAVVPVNENGEAVATLIVSNKTSINTVRVNPDMGSIPDKFFFIQGVADRAPVGIIQKFYPEPPTVSIKGDPVTITYTVIDKFGNGIGNTPVTITTSLGEDFSRYTNSVGQTVLTYGPKDTIGDIVLKATATDPSGTQPTCERILHFVAQDIQALQFTAAPNIMPSLDVEGTMNAVLKAKLVDKNGNPVVGQDVTFSMGVPDYGDTDVNASIAGPILGATSAETDANGIAEVIFTPGEFTTDKNNANYDDSASGSCSVTASWNNMAQTLQLSWMNYPYLSIETEVSPQTVKVGDTVDIKVRVKGDGWALMPTPIDAILCTDRSGSMLKDEPDDRMVPVMAASKVFTGAMQVNLIQDRIGLISFGVKGPANLNPVPVNMIGNATCYDPVSGTWHEIYLNGMYWDWTSWYGVTVNNPANHLTTLGESAALVSLDNSWEFDENIAYSRYWPYTEIGISDSDHYKYVKAHYPGSPRNYADYAIMESPLDYKPDTDNINSAIDNIVPAGGTPLRYGLYLAIKEIKDNGRPEAIRAVIVLSDGDYNYYGDPLARGTSTTTIALPKLTPKYWYIAGLSDSEQNLSVYANNNNIRIYSIGYATDISDGGKDTLKKLAENTGGEYYFGTSTDIIGIYEEIAEDLKEEAGVNTVMNLNYGTIEINDVPSPVTGNLKYIPSTVITSSYFDGETLTRVDNPQQTIDQSGNFSVQKKLDFPIGTIKLGDIWEAKYTLQVLKNGTINIFGPSSNVKFNGTEGSSQIMVPKTYITAIDVMPTTTIGIPTLDIKIDQVSSDSDTGIAEWKITRTYTGKESLKQDIYISIDGKKTWILVSSNIFATPADANNNINNANSFSINWNDLPPVEFIDIKVVGNAPDIAGPVTREIHPRRVTANPGYIVLS